MVITQSACFNGYKDMDLILIPQFQERDEEARGRDFLKEQGVSHSAMSSTSLRPVFFKVFSENLVRAPFKKKKGWPDRSSRGLLPVGSTTEMGVDIGHAHLCTLQ